MYRAIRRRCKILVLSVACLLLSTDWALASHAVGADLTYACLGGNQYEITLAFYRDCSGISAPGSASISIASASCGQSLSLSLTQVPGTGQEVSPICISMQTTCTGGAFPGIQEWVYTGIVTLPAQCNDWLFSYSTCCRNAAITNITSPSSQSMYIEAMLNNTLGCNSSPVFSNKPVPFVCDNQLFCFSPGALDPEYDSLVYSLITPMTSISATVTYTGSFSPAQPLSSSPAVTFNAVTGDLCMTPTNTSEVTVTAIRVEQWRDGVLIGYVMRDIQINVVACTNIVPDITGFDGNPPNSGNTQITVCSGAPITETISSFDADGAQIVTMTWNNGIPAATFTITGSPHPTGVFSWTPTNADQSSTPYCFTVTVQDDNCPYNASFTQSYCITVKGLNVNAGPAASISCDSSAAVTSAATGGIAPYTYLWDNGATGTATVMGCGIHEVAVVDSVGCTGLDTVSVFCFNAPVAGFSSAPVCLNNPTAFTDTSSAPSPTSITGWDWDFGDGSATVTNQNPSHTYTSSGTFGVQLVVTNDMGCTDSISDSILVKPSPVALFTSTSVCLGDPTIFTDASTVGIGGIASWSWFFGDSSNTTSSLQNPTNTYLTSGTFNATLVVTSDSGCPNIVVLPVEVYALPVANFTWNDACFGDTSYFNDVSTVAGAAINSWAWDFGDGSGTSTSQNPDYVYASTGSYLVELIVSSSFGCMDTIQFTAEVYAAPTSDFTNTTVCANDFTQFTDISTVPIGIISAWQWDFGNGSTSDVSSPQSSYSSGGTYDVTLIVTSDNGCLDTTIKSINVNFLPTAGFSSTDVCLNDVTTVTDNSISAPDPIVYAVWNFDDGSPLDTNPVPSTHLFLISDTFNTQLVVITSNGCSDTVVQQVIVFALPIPDFTVADTCFDDPSIFFDMSTAPAGDLLTTWAWDFGDGLGNSTVQNPTYTYDPAGNYTVTLVVTSDKGCSEFINLPVEVYPLPPVNFTFNSACPGFATQFMYNPAPGVVSWNWDYGEGGTSSLQQAPYIYVDSGTYDVQLIVVDGNQCRDSITKSVRAYPEPIADFVFSPIDLTILFPFVTFTNTSWDGFYYSWDLGDGFTYNTYSDSVYVHEYSDQDTGRYIVRLTVTNSYGCQDSIRDTVIIVGDHTLFVPNAFTPNFDGSNDTFFPMGLGIDNDEFEMMIYDRWGDMIFKSDGFNQSWDGRSNKGGEVAQQDVYVWFIKVRGLDGEAHQYIGHVSLVK